MFGILFFSIHLLDARYHAVQECMDRLEFPYISRQSVIPLPNVRYSVAGYLVFGSLVLGIL